MLGIQRMRKWNDVYIFNSSAKPGTWTLWIAFEESEQYAQDRSIMYLTKVRPPTKMVETLARQWSLPKDLVQETLSVVTILAKCTYDCPRHFRNGHAFRYLHRNRINCSTLTPFSES